ncbi:MAG: 23S rRNA (pseudouridine(1915)-N(3))-methyltransferase RlmH [Flavobacteriaceae bacterium]|jgi:23S rRNA (pseudouridine1915-N3)-methyltransferase|nr:23S rRNA (pseudouridine(1915)-N(3))-methyltransferase RlmH [Flavobacteriaceae bacterium]CAI8325968.1 MAG: Ribosomal RNA large subunit methyltransferase H [Flavobacteriaceae bacterium]|tara:strand:- start:2374 stop:2841 length:468 start_codon:yes stop_codon:yes gene_type:complete
MNIKLIVIGETNSKDLKQLIDQYASKLKFYINFELIVLKDQKKKMQKNIQIKKEGEKIISVLKKNDFIVILDEHGQHKSSLEFSEFIQKKLNSGMKTLTFIIGGPYGFSDEIKSLSNQQLSLSKMTFSHEMVRLFFTEQLYRAFSILNNEPYHHQ